MPPHSGKFGAVNGVSTSRSWTFEDVSSPHVFSGSNLVCGKARKRGTLDWTGSISGYGAIPPAMPGEAIAFVGYVAPDNDTSGNGDQVAGSAVVTQATVNFNWENGEPINWTLAFGGNGPNAWTVGTQVTDSTNVDAPDICGTGIVIDDGSDTPINDVTSATLTITSDVKTYVNSSSYSGGKCWTRRKGGHIDWTLAVNQQCTKRGVAAAPEIGTNPILQLFVDDTDFWLLKWAHVVSYTGITVDMETGNITGRTINFAKNGWNGSLGEVTKPGALVTWWPMP